MKSDNTKILESVLIEMRQTKEGIILSSLYNMFKNEEEKDLDKNKLSVLDDYTIVGEEE